MSTSAAASTSAGSSLLGGSRSASISTGSGVQQLSNMNTNAALFREIHKNTWLKRLTADGKKVTVGPKKSERSWVVFCVHDDSKALLEGYAEPRQAASHNPEWVVSMQETQHISHALIPNSHEFEFVVTLSYEVVRFHATSWEVMQEWVETLRSKLREMKIISPRENLYTKLPEIRAPLLPTRDPTSPLPAPPPVPAALVPGVERVAPHGMFHSTVDATTTTTTSSEPLASVAITGSTTTVTNSTIITTTSSPTSTNYFSNIQTIHSLSTMPSTSSQLFNTSLPNLTSMSNTLSQNLLNMLSDPITAYSEQLQGDNLTSDISSDIDEQFLVTMPRINEEVLISPKQKMTNVLHDDQGTAIEAVESTNEIILASDNSVRLDVGNTEGISIDQNKTLENLPQREKISERPQTSRSHSLGNADCKRQKQQHLLNDAIDIKTQTKSSNSNNIITEPEINVDTEMTQTTTATDPETNITIIQVTNAHEKPLTEYANNKQNKNLDKTMAAGDIFTFPESSDIPKYEEYKSNVQIIPSNSNNSSTIQVIGQNVTTVANQYTTPVKKNFSQTAAAATTLESATAKTSVFPTPGSHLENHKITTVHVGDSATVSTVPSVYGTCYTSPGPVAASTTPVLSKKIILSANTSGITNITVNTTETNIHKNNASTGADNNVRYNVGNVRYEKVFLSSSSPIVKSDSQETPTPTLNVATARAAIAPLSPKMNTHLCSPQRQPNSIQIDRLNLTAASSTSLPSSPAPLLAFSALGIQTQKPTTSGQLLSQASHTSVMRSNSKQLHNSLQPNAKADIGGGTSSPAMQRKVLSPNHHGTDTPPVPTRTRFLTRGLTEAVITARPSRKDFCSTKTKAVGKVEQQSGTSSNATTSNNNIEAITTVNNCEIIPSQTHSAVGRTRSESLEQRRRSSSTSEAQTQRSRVVTNNNEFIPNRAALGNAAAMRMQQPPHSFRNLENGSLSPSIAATSSASKRMTLREQQVIQLRREIMHPGGVRLQLRRKDCVGSIAWVDAFGAIWVAGWKQKEHPVLYNALHIGDQLLSIAGISINTAAEANKVIRNTNTLFVEVLIRRIPFGRGYAIRRDREGQCLGLIRDGNTSTIVDVVPNSLAARHGLPPKAQSCDGSTLTFWMLTEINGRPLNLFFKENEIRDRLNSVGRDISILVQPSDLITKLKKQLKSLRSYKDYLVQ